MSYGTGEPSLNDYGDADSWGGPDNGIDVASHMGDVGANLGKKQRVSEDGWLAIYILGALAILWLLGGVGFRKVRM